jgi:hypothetical protein
MFKHDPLRRQSYQVFIFCALSCIIWILYFAEVYFHPGQQPWGSLSSFILFFAPAYVILVMIVSIVGVISQARRWKRLDQLRLRALQGDQTLLAKVQPVADAFALPIPTTIRLRSTSKVYLILLCFIAMIVLVTVIGAIVASHHLSTTAILVLLLVVIFIIVVGAVVSILTYMLVRRSTVYEIALTEQGITTKYRGYTTRITWNNARFFALSDRYKRALPQTYELDSDDAVARWMWIPRNMYRAFSFEPSMSYEEYNRRMQSLLDLIAAKTRLQLYDLSETRSGIYM